MYNTPPTYAIYILGLVLEWIENLGGLEAMAKRNEAKAQLLYDYLDSSDFYRGAANKDDRSLMNVFTKFGYDDNLICYISALQGILYGIYCYQ
jgi:phosphoserine aminotransferase